MISVSKRIPVNEPGQPVLTRADVWQGLVLKADNALPFVPAMTYCKVESRKGENELVREIELRGERCHERVVLTPKSNVHFTRLDGSVLGDINNDIEEDAQGLWLRFSFNLRLAGEADGSPAEVAYGKTMEGDYLKAVDATLAAIRKLKIQRNELIRDYYKAVDSMDLRSFATFHADDNSRVVFANFPPAVGPEQIAGAIGQFWSSIGGLSHKIVNRWDTQSESVLEVVVNYTRKDGGRVALPCVTILEPSADGSKIKDLRIHIDVAPLYAPAEAVAEPA